MAGPSVNSPKAFLKPHRTRPRMVLRGRAIHITIISSNFLHGLSFGVKLGVFSCRFGTVSPDIYRKIKQIGVPLESLLRYQPRSEEHTSELQSLMRISYAVFCLKKKKKNKKKSSHKRPKYIHTTKKNNRKIPHYKKQYSNCTRIK